MSEVTAYVRDISRHRPIVAGNLEVRTEDPQERDALLLSHLSILGVERIEAEGVLDAARSASVEADTHVGDRSYAVRIF